MKLVIYFFIFIVGAFLRRWLGGGFDKYLSEHRIVCLFCIFIFGLLILLLKQLGF